FPTTAGAYQVGLKAPGAWNVFVTKFNPGGGSTLAYSTYLGGKNRDFANGIALDSSGNAYVTGWTSSVNYPITPGAFQTAMGVHANENGFVTKLNSTGSSLVYSSYLGGGGYVQDVANAIAVDSSGYAYV